MFCFKNVGNSCYINAAIQCLMRLPLFNEALDNVTLDDKLTDPPHLFFREYNDLRRMALDNDNCTISPALFRHAVQLYAKHKKNQDFYGLNQNDAAEFIQFVLHGVHEALAKPQDFDSVPIENDTQKKCIEMMKATFSKEFSDVVHLFYGVQLSCIKENVTPEAFLTLNLSIPEAATTLTECIHAYVSDETIEGWVDEKTLVRENVVKSLRFFRLPTILFVCLKRFSADGRKNDKLIDIPLQFKIDESVYDLKCGCLHQGNIFSGHYTAFANIKDKWTVIDDDTYYPLTNLSKNAYCMFYVQQV